MAKEARKKARKNFVGLAFINGTNGVDKNF